MKFGVVIFPGTWSDCDFHYVIQEILRQPVEYVWHRERNLSGFDCVILPGGFSYGDYLRAGAIAGRSPIVEALPEFVAKGGLVLGSCNGFQILCEAKLLSGALTRNECLQYRCQWTHVLVENAETPFTRACRPGQVLKMPISHGEGRYYADQATLAQLKAQNQIVFRSALRPATSRGRPTPTARSRTSPGSRTPRGRCSGSCPTRSARARARWAEPMASCSSPPFSVRSSRKGASRPPGSFAPGRFGRLNRPSGSERETAPLNGMMTEAKPAGTALDARRVAGA